MFSDALYIMDKNAERLTVDDLQKQLAEEQEKNESLQKEVTSTDEERDKAVADSDAVLARVAELEAQHTAESQQYEVSSADCI